jgi:hypothetical protein
LADAAGYFGRCIQSLSSRRDSDLNASRFNARPTALSMAVSANAPARD